MPDAMAQLMVGPLFRRGVFFFSRGSKRMYSGTSSVPKIYSGSRLRLKTKEGGS
jgi:hypothetical protein